MNLIEVNELLQEIEKRGGGGAKPAGSPKKPSGPMPAGGARKPFNESLHRRDEDGQFTSGGGSNGLGQNPKHPTTLEGPNALYMSVGRGANGDSREAKKASMKADETNSRADHKVAAAAHDKAAKSHKKAFTLATQAKLPEASKIHMSLEKYHIESMRRHMGHAQ